MSEDDVADYRQQDAEERERSRLISMGQRRGPDAPEACERCVKGMLWTGDGKKSNPYRKIECPRCLGTGVQP